MMHNVNYRKKAKRIRATTDDTFFIHLIYAAFSLLSLASLTKRLFKVCFVTCYISFMLLYEKCSKSYFPVGFVAIIALKCYFHQMIKKCELY